MRSLKEHLKSIRKIEQEQRSYDLMIEYFSSDTSSLPTGLCEGAAFLPSFMLLKELKSAYHELCKADSELLNLFNTAIKCSKLFYSKTTELVESESSDINNKYEHMFEKLTQPIGQKLINLLANIKYRIKVVRLKNCASQNSKTITPYYLWQSFTVRLYSAIAHIQYMITLATSSNQGMVRKFYYSSMLCSIIAFWAYNYAFLNDLSSVSSIFLGIISGIVVILLAIISYPMGDFGKKDISGRNMVAYKYKLLLNNRRSNRLVKVFTLQHSKNIGAASNMTNK